MAHLDLGRHNARCADRAWELAKQKADVIDIGRPHLMPPIDPMILLLPYAQTIYSIVFILITTCLFTQEDSPPGRYINISSVPLLHPSLNLFQRTRIADALSADPYKD